MGRSAGCGETEQSHEGQHEERAGARAEKTVVKTDHEGEDGDEGCEFEAGGAIDVLDRGREGEIERDGDHGGRDEDFKRRGIDLLDDDGAQKRAGEGRADGGDQRENRYIALAPIGPGGNRGADDGLGLVGGDGPQWRQAGPQQGGNCDEATTAGDCIHKACDDADAAQRNKYPDIVHGKVRPRVVMTRRVACMKPGDLQPDR